MTEHLKAVLKKIKDDPRYAEGVQYGKPRRGHQEGSVAAHIKDLEANVEKLQAGKFLSEEEYWKLMILVHVHDTMKYASKKNAPIEDVDSHASMARAFLNGYTVDRRMLNIVQYHDIGYSLSQSFREKGRYNGERLRTAVFSISQEYLKLFLLFVIVDGYTPSKEQENVRWFIEEVQKNFISDCSGYDLVNRAMLHFGL